MSAPQPCDCTRDALEKCQQTHQDLDASVAGMLRNLSLSDKQKLVEQIAKWVGKR